MKSISSALLTALGEFSGINRADLISITLPSGQGIFAVHGSWDVLFGGTQYFASAFGTWERGAVTSEADFGLTSNAMELSVVVDTDIPVLLPGTSVPLMSTIYSGFWDGAIVNVDTVYMPLGQWGNVIGSLTLFSGFIVDFPKLGRSKATFSVRDWAYVANLKTPIRVIQPSCFNTLYDSRCTVNAAAFTFNNNVAAGSTSVTINPGVSWPSSDGHGNNPQVSPYFVQGKVIWTSGQNKGLSSHIAAQVGGANGALTLQGPPAFAVAVGDTFQALAGCDKLSHTCSGKFSNIGHFQGFPFVPPPEAAAG